MGKRVPVRRFKHGRGKQDPSILAIVDGNLKKLQNFINKVGLHYCATWMEGYTLLCIAVKTRRSQMAHWLISINCRINRVIDDDTSDTPLHLAIIHNEDTIAKELIEKGACINVKNTKGETPLHISCRKQNRFIARLLLQNNSEADIPDNDLSTPLHIAVEKECFEIVQLLLNSRVNVNVCTMKYSLKGFTPLHIAILKKNEEMVKILIVNGAVIHSTIGISHTDALEDNNIDFYLNYEGYTPLHLAVIMNNDNIIKLLLDYGANVNAAAKPDGMTPLHLAVQNKNKKTVMIFSECNANFKARTKDGRNILHLAVANDWPELIEVLLLKNADVNDQTSNGETPLHIAVEMGDEVMVELLLEYKADVNIKNGINQIPLHIAAEYSIEIVNILLSKGANIDDIDNNNETPLSIAIKQKHKEIVEELLQYRPSIHNSSNRSAFIFALKSTECSYIEIINLLFNYGFIIKVEDVTDELLYNTVCMGYFNIVKYILEFGHNLRSENKLIKLLLHKAVLNEDFKMAKLLIKHKCHLNTMDDNKQTPLGYAILNNNLEMLDLLLINGAKIENVELSILTAAKNGNIMLFQILLKYGANISVNDEFGTTPLHFAIWNRHNRFIEFLMNKQKNINTINLTKKIVREVPEHDYIIEKYMCSLKRQILASPLHIAVSKNSHDTCIILLENYANVNSVDGNNRTPLHIAAAVRSADQKNIIKTLLSYGANINALDYFRKLPIYYIYNQTCTCSIAFQNQYELYNECECYDYQTDMDAVAAIFIKQIMLLTSLNKTIHEGHLEFLSRDDFCEQLQISCLSEISKMKEENICDNVCLYDILTKKSNALAAYARNENVFEAFESNNYESKFPLYWDLLKDQFSTAKTRQNLIKSAFSSLSKLLNLTLPEIIADKIFEPLNLKDLNNLSLASSDYKYYESHINPVKRLKIFN